MTITSGLRAAGIAALFSLTCCSLSWQEADGSRRVLGWVNLRIADATDSTTFAGNAIDLTTIGLGVVNTGEETILTAGYLNITTAKLRDHALVIGNPLALSSILPPRATR